MEFTSPNKMGLIRMLICIVIETASKDIYITHYNALQQESTTLRTLTKGPPFRSAKSTVYWVPVVILNCSLQCQTAEVCNINFSVSEQIYLSMPNRQIPEARSIGVIAEQTKVLLFAKRSHGSIIRLLSCDHEHKQ